ncbi:hypothetical protein U1Q18_003627 [Sarracenia purpurea var. burkii]
MVAATELKEAIGRTQGVHKMEKRGIAVVGLIGKRTNTSGEMVPGGDDHRRAQDPNEKRLRHRHEDRVFGGPRMP